MPELFTLPHSAVVQAGAGTGKTHSLVTLCLHLLSGAGRKEPLPAAKLWAVTFTEKAAAELQGRLRQRLGALAEGLCGEPELLATYARAGVPLPEPAFFRRLRRDLGQAQVGTIHSLCGQILRRHAADAGLDPAFEVLDEAQARRLLREACESAALRSLDGAVGPEAEAAARRLCGEMGFRGQGRFVAGLADELASLLSALGESGRTPSALVEETAGLSRSSALDEDRKARSDLRRALEELGSALRQGVGGANKTAQAAAVAVGAFAGLEFDHSPGALAAAWPRLERAAARLPVQTGGAIADQVRAVKSALSGLLEADAGLRAGGLARDLALVAGHAFARQSEEKARKGVLDFDDLTRLCRDLLARSPGARAAERARVGVLLVDELQDTSRAQIELFRWLLGDGESQPGALRPGALVVVGDRKQSIYEFRGADVAGAQAFAGRALAEGAERHLLQQSRRSRPALVEFANLLFSRALPASSFPFATPFTPDDALAAHRPPGEPGPCAELLDVSGAGVEAEAEVVARRLAALLAPGSPARVHDRDELARPVRGGDVAVLFRRLTNLEAFRRALLRRRIPHLVYKGRGFHETREVQDLLSLLTLAVDPDDTLALATVLRSPFGPVSDDGLVLLARGPREHGEARGLSRRSLTDSAARAALEPDDAATVDRLARLLRWLQREVDRLGPASLLEAALAETDYLAACAGGLYGEQATANLDKLLSLARAAEQRGESVRSLLLSLRTAALDEEREAEAPVVEERDPHAVRLLTIHAAKGLEFPIVFVPECASPALGPNAARVLLEPELGFAIKARAADGRYRWGAHGAAVKERKEERELAQARRLFYVAVTRARDLVVLSGQRPRGKQNNSFRAWLDEAAPEGVQRGLLRVLVDGGPPVPSAPAERAPVDSLVALGEPSAAHQSQVARLSQRAPRAQPTVAAPVTQVADAQACARRYQLLHELRLEERPAAEPTLPDPLGPEPDRPATALGTLAHRLLELVPLRLPAAERRPALSRLLELEGEEPALHGEVLDAACDFLDSPLAQRLAAAGKEPLLRRELAFTLRLAPGPEDPPGPELFLRGQIDALLLDQQSATVIDFKLSQARDPARYAAQLDAYALAAHELVQGALPVRTGIVFLRTKGAPFAERPAGELAQVRRGLLAAARAIAEGRQTGVWPRIEQSRCEELGCGFVRRCHS